MRKVIICVAVVVAGYTAGRAWLQRDGAAAAPASAATSATSVQPASFWPSLLGPDNYRSGNSAALTGPTPAAVAANPSSYYAMASPAPVAAPVAMTPPETIAIDYSSPELTFRSLQRVAQFDDNADNRISAVAQLRQIAVNNVANGDALEAIRTATVDMDERVAGAAQAAYDEVAAMRGSRPR